jgi:iron(III) transport system substrate-binding protein
VNSHVEKSMRYVRTSVFNICMILSACVLSAICAIVSAAAQDKAARQAEWEKIVESAKKDGQLTIYSGAIPALIIDEGVFQKRFPAIKIVTVVGEGGAGAAQRIMAERRAQKYVADLTMGSSSSIWTLYSIKALDPIKPALMLPEVTDESKWWQGMHRYVDPEKRHIFTFMGSPREGSVYYNKNIVNPNEFTSFWDFLEPKWKGKIEARDLRASGTAAPSMRFLYYHPELGAKFLRRLFGEMDVTLFRDRRLSVDWLVTEKFPICFLCLPTEISKAKSQGLPVETFGPLKEGSWLDSLTGNIGLLNKAPHRNAAIVFLNWLLSREGQLTAQHVHARADIGVSNSLRVDIPKDMVPSDERPVSGVKYLDVDVAERISSEPVLKLFNEALADAEKKR